MRTIGEHGLQALRNWWRGKPALALWVALIAALLISAMTAVLANPAWAAGRKPCEEHSTLVNLR